MPLLRRALVCCLTFPLPAQRAGTYQCLAAKKIGQLL